MILDEKTTSRHENLVKSGCLQMYTGRYMGNRRLEPEWPAQSEMIMKRTEPRRKKVTASKPHGSMPERGLEDRPPASLKCAWKERLSLYQLSENSPQKKDYYIKIWGIVQEVPRRRKCFSNRPYWEGKASFWRCMRVSQIQYVIVSYRQWNKDCQKLSSMEISSNLRCNKYVNIKYVFVLCIIV